jgi:hypothetical protein
LSEVVYPYVQVGGAWSLPDDFLHAFAWQMYREGVFDRVFYNGTPVDGFLSAMQKPSNLPVFLFNESKPVGVAWLNGVRSGVAFAHFCGLRACRGRSVELGQAAIGYWFEKFDFLHVLMGTIPASNVLALRFIKRLGFTALGEVPGMLYDANQEKRVAGVICYRGRG